MANNSDPKRELLRHALATLAYRGGKATRNAPANFAEYRCNETSRTPGQILGHIGDLLDWGLSIAQGKQTWRDSGAQNWDKDVERRLPGFGPAAGGIAGEIISGTDRGCADACRADRDVAAHGRSADQGRKLFCCRNWGWPRWAGAGCAEKGI